MMIESAITLNAIVTNYRTNSGCGDTTFKMMLEEWAENIFAEECRPINYGLPSDYSRVAGEAEEATEWEMAQMRGAYLCERLPSEAVPATTPCKACNGTGEALGILPWRSYPCKTCGGRGVLS